MKRKLLLRLQFINYSILKLVTLFAHVCTNTISKLYMLWIFKCVYHKYIINTIGDPDCRQLITIKYRACQISLPQVKFKMRANACICAYLPKFFLDWTVPSNACNVLIDLKPPEHSWGINMGNNVTKNLKQSK